MAYNFDVYSTLPPELREALNQAASSGLTAEDNTAIDDFVARDFSERDHLLYLSPINGNDDNDGFRRSLPLAAGGTTNSLVVANGTTTTVETSGGSTALLLTANDLSLIGLELRLYHTVTTSTETQQSRLITGNTITGFTVSPAFDVPPVSGDTFVIVAPIKTHSEMMRRAPQTWAKRNFTIGTKEKGPISGQTGGSAQIVSSPLNNSTLGVPIVRVQGLTGMTSASVGRALALGGAIIEAQIGADPTPTPKVAATTANNGFFEIVNWVNSTTVDVRAASAVTPDANNATGISWQEYQGLVANGSGSSSENYYSRTPLDSPDGVSMRGWIGDFTDELLGSHSTPTSAYLTTATGTTNAQLTITGGLNLPSAVLSGPPTARTAAQLPPAGGSLISGFVGLVPGAWVGYQLWVVSGTATGCVREIVANDATTVTVSEAFSPAPTTGDRCIIDLFGQHVLVVTGSAAGHRKKLVGGIRGVSSNVTAISGGVGTNQATITGLAGLTSTDVPVASGTAAGTSGGSTTDTVITSTGTLTVNALKGFFLTFTTGPAAGQTRQVVSNTTSTVTVDSAFSPAPTAGGGDDFAVGALIQHRGFVNSGNNGLHAITTFISGTSVTVLNASAVVETPSGNGTTASIGNWFIVGGVSLAVCSPFSPATIAGNTVRIERAAVDLRGVVNWKYSGNMCTLKGWRFIGNTTASRGFGPGFGSYILPLGCEIAARGGTVSMFHHTLWAGPNADFLTGALGSLNPFNGTLYGDCVAYIHGTSNINLGNFARGTHLILSNTLMNCYQSQQQFSLLFGRQVTVRVFHLGLLIVNANATTRSFIDRNYPTMTSAQGLFDFGATSSAGSTDFGFTITNVDLMNGNGHGIRVNEHSWANLISVKGCGNAGYGLSLERMSKAQVRVSGSTPTTVTGTLGDVSLGTDVVGFNSLVSYPALLGLPSGQVGINHYSGATLATSTTTTGTTSTVITDSAGTFAVNELRGLVLKMTSGTASGQQRVISSNTATTITVGAAFNPAPSDLGETYRVETLDLSFNRVEKVSP